MSSMYRSAPLLYAALALSLAVPSAGQTLAQALANMDQAASHFKGLSANVSYLQHMDVIHEDDAQSGTILVKRPRPKEVHVKIAIEKPDAKVAVTDGNKVAVYYPRSGEEQDTTIGQRRSLMDMILTLGFGGNSRELQSQYDVKLGGAETVGGQSTTRLELIPKSKDMLDQWKKIDLWISDKTGCAVQQKFYERGKDYTLITYADVQLNPEIPDAALKLDVPKGTRKEPLNKK